MKKSLSLVAAGLTALSMAANGADIVVIVNPNAAAPTKERVMDVYLGEDDSLAPMDLPESEPIRTSFYKSLTGRTLQQVKATWSRIVFSGKGQPPKEVPDAAAVKKAVAANAKAVGYIDKSAVDASVKVAFSLE